jgi:molecular chaperone Hsp33
MKDEDVRGALSASDIVVPFQFDNAPLRGRLARLGPSVDAVLSAHAYPDVVSHILGEALTLTALLGTALKFDGIFTVQAQGDGPLSLLVADCETGDQATGARLCLVRRGGSRGARWSRLVRSLRQGFSGAHH